MSNEALPTIITPGDPEFYLPEHQDSLDALYWDLTPTREAALQLAQDHMETFELGDVDDTRFNMVRFVPEDTDGSVVVVFAEFGHGEKHTAGIIRALAIQRLANPRAILVLQLSDTLGEEHMNFSTQEVKSLGGGDYEPYVARVNAALENTPEFDRDAEVAVVGMSHGATSATKYAAHYETRATGAVVAAVPNNVDRSGLSGHLRIGKAFFSDTKIEEVIERNGYPLDDSSITIEQDLIKELKSGMLEYARGIVRRQRVNRALLASMAQPTFEHDAYMALSRRDVAMDQILFTEDKISLAGPSRETAMRLGSLGLGNASLEVLGEDHSGTNDNGLLGEVTRRNIVK